MIVGRKAELELLNNVYNDTKSHLVSICGRKGTGKTYLVEEVYRDKIVFHHSGVANGTLTEQLFSFNASLKNCFYNPKEKLINWFVAFEELKNLIRESKIERKIIFIDELSWMDTTKSDMMRALESFWNGWASYRNDIILIVCASATSWMLKKIIHNKGGLYNRITEQINLLPFTLKEVEECLKAKGILSNRIQILQYYMVLGGIPYYYNFIQKGLSVAQNIDNMLFKSTSPLKDEFKYLFASIFKNSEPYLKIIGALSKKKIGMTREDIIKESKLANSGDLTIKLEELESCSFIRKYNCFGMKSKGALYQITDPFIIFYYTFMNNNENDENFFQNLYGTPKLNTFFGFAFERVCLLHINQIKDSLGIRGVYTTVNSWHAEKDLENGVNGSQIDLLIVRKDEVINLCEMKYSTSEFTITDKFLKDLSNKINDLVTVTKTKYAIYPTLVTTFGVKENRNSTTIQSVVTLDALFK